MQLVSYELLVTLTLQIVSGNLKGKSARVGRFKVGVVSSIKKTSNFPFFLRLFG